MAIVSLVSHNAYWFQGTPSLWGEERTTAHPLLLDALVELYAALDPDILCLQEIPSAETFGVLRSRLSMEGVFCPGAGRAAYGGAILWRGMAAEADDLSHRHVNGDGVFERMCLQLSARVNGRDLSLINIHLASNRFAPDRHGEPVRLAELGALEEACPYPDVIVGDFNATPDSSVHARMEARGFVDTGRDYEGGGRAREKRVDYIWVRADWGPSVTDYEVVSGNRFELEGHPGVALSDHHPVRVRLELQPPSSGG